MTEYRKELDRAMQYLASKEDTIFLGQSMVYGGIAYPRWNFLLLAADQLVNHLDKLVEMTEGQFNPKVIIRVAVGVKKPVDPQEQHVGDFTESFAKILRNITVVKLESADEVFGAYKEAYDRDHSTILVEEHQF